MKKHRVFSSFLSAQEYSFELIITAVLVALGVNLLSSAIIECIAFPNKYIVIIIVGLLLSLGATAYVSRQKLRYLTRTANIKGFIIYNLKTQNLVKIPEYDISRDMVRYLSSAFFENGAIEKKWKTGNNLQATNKEPSPDNKFDKMKLKNKKLVIELIEYCVLSKLCTHLRDYFNGKDLEAKLSEFGPKDIPDVLFENSFLKLFSEDMNNRAAFMCNDNRLPDSRKNAEVVLAWSPNGAFYEKFDLVLPEKSTIRKASSNCIVIDSPILQVSITSKFDGFGTVIPYSFTKFYMGINDFRRDHTEYRFDIKFEVKYKFTAIFSKDKKLYYEWIDSFLDVLANYADEKAFFEKINWDTVNTMIQCRIASNTQKDAKDTYGKNIPNDTKQITIQRVSDEIE